MRRHLSATEPDCAGHSLRLREARDTFSSELPTCMYVVARLAPPNLQSVQNDEESKRRRVDLQDALVQNFDLSYRKLFARKVTTELLSIIIRDISF